MDMRYPTNTLVATLLENEVRALRLQVDERDTFLFDKQTVTQYLDALPFPADQLVANRAQVCDYCFFGCPTRTAVKP